MQSATCGRGIPIYATTDKIPCECLSWNSKAKLWGGMGARPHSHAEVRLGSTGNSSWDIIPLINMNHDLEFEASRRVAPSAHRSLLRRKRWENSKSSFIWLLGPLGYHFIHSSVHRSIPRSARLSRKGKKECASQHGLWSVKVCPKQGGPNLSGLRYLPMIETVGSCNLLQDTTISDRQVCWFSSSSGSRYGFVRLLLNLSFSYFWLHACTRPVLTLFVIPMSCCYSWLWFHVSVCSLSSP